MQKYLDPRPDVAISIFRIPEDRPASNHLEAGTGIKHQSPQLIHFRQARLLFDLDKLRLRHRCIWVDPYGTPRWWG